MEIADKLVQSGRLGRKTNAGWYSYSEEGIPRYDKFVDKIILAESENASITRRTFTMDEIQRRLILSMINEAAKILSEKIAQSTLDIDLVTVLGYGFPRWRGGLMHHANNIGWKYIFESLEKLCREDEIFGNQAILFFTFQRMKNNTLFNGRRKHQSLWLTSNFLVMTVEIGLKLSPTNFCPVYINLGSSTCFPSIKALTSTLR